MATLKDLRTRIDTVKSTQKITSAMKMVAAAKFRRAQEHAEAARPYTEKMGKMINALASRVKDPSQAPLLLAGTGNKERQLVVVATSDRGLCGGFNATIVRDARRLIQQFLAEGNEVGIVTIGRKAKDMLRREYSSRFVASFEDIAKPRVNFATADEIMNKVLNLYTSENYDEVTLIYNKFKSALTQIVTRQKLIPFTADANEEADESEALYIYEPSEETLLEELLPKNLTVQLYGALLENAASEQGARMTAMDNATRNAGDMIKSLRITYNRTRQAVITKELIEVISGAEAV